MWRYLTGIRASRRRCAMWKRSTTPHTWSWLRKSPVPRYIRGFSGKSICWNRRNCEIVEVRRSQHALITRHGRTASLSNRGHAIPILQCRQIGADPQGHHVAVKKVSGEKGQRQATHNNFSALHTEETLPEDALASREVENFDL